MKTRRLHRSSNENHWGRSRLSGLAAMAVVGWKYWSGNTRARIFLVLLQHNIHNFRKISTIFTVSTYLKWLFLYIFSQNPYSELLNTLLLQKQQHIQKFLHENFSEKLISFFFHRKKKLQQINKILYCATAFKNENLKQFNILALTYNF